ncbi:MAG: response regulator [Oligoflexia bacterium]|nr:response regulator [Oligoflexia bacterium]
MDNSMNGAIESIATRKSLRQRLVLFIIGLSTIALLASASTIVWIEAHAIRLQRNTDLDILATTIANNSAAALAFNDQAAAREIIQSIQLDSDIVEAIIFDRAGNVFARYSRSTSPLNDSSILHYLDIFPAIHSSKAISLKQEYLGTLSISSTTGKLKQRMARFLNWIALITAACIAVVIVISRWLGATVLAPIIRLSEVAAIVTSTKNYALRASSDSPDEVGLLVDSFNLMLSEIQRRDEQLSHEHQQLEQRVAERTRELVVAKDLAETANRAKGQFLANMSHELRTPLNAVIGYADLLASRDDVSGEVREQLQTIHSSGSLLLALINDILDLSKIDSHKMQVESVPCDLVKIVQGIPPLFMPSAREKGIDLLLSLDPNMPTKVMADPVRLRQVLVNLVGNAVKFTEKGKVELSVQVVSRDERNLTTTFLIRDSGIGIPQNKLATIFQAFDQADGSTTRRFGGTGLGLSIASGLVQLMGSKISVNSQEGLGSEFSFTLKLPLPSRKEAPPKPQPAKYTSQISALHATKFTVLVAEDNAVNTKLVTAILAKCGYKVICAADGVEAVEQFSKHPIDIILMDLQMPRMSGIEATKNIRTMSSGAKVPIIALTAHAFEESKDECLKAGIDVHLAKPIDAKQLISTIEKLLVRASS